MKGYQVRLGERTLRGLEDCLARSHADTIQRKFGKSANIPETAPSIFTTRFEHLVDVYNMPSYSKSSAMNRVVLRDLLLEPIKDTKKIQYQKKLDFVGWIGTVVRFISLIVPVLQFYYRVTAALATLVAEYPSLSFVILPRPNQASVLDGGDNLMTNLHTTQVALSEADVAKSKSIFGTEPPLSVPRMRW